MDDVDAFHSNSPQASDMRRLELLYSPTRQDNEDTKSHKLHYWKSRVRDYLLSRDSFEFSLEEVMRYFEDASGCGLIPDSFDELVKTHPEDFELKKEPNISIFQNPLQIFSMFTGRKSSESCSRYVFIPLLKEVKELIREQAESLSEEKDRTLLVADLPSFSRCFPTFLRLIADRVSRRDQDLALFLRSINQREYKSTFLDYLRKESVVSLSDERDVVKILTNDDRVAAIDKRMSVVLKLKGQMGPLEEKKKHLEGESDRLAIDIKSHLNRKMKDLAMVALKTKKECDKELESTCIHLYNLERFLLRADNPTVGVLSGVFSQAIQLMRESNKDGSLERFQDIVDEFKSEMAEFTENMDAIAESSRVSPEEEELNRELDEFLSMDDSSLAHDVPEMNKDANYSAELIFPEAPSNAISSPPLHSQQGPSVGLVGSGQSLLQYR